MKKVGEKSGQFKKRPYLCGAKPERAEHAAAGTPKGRKVARPDSLSRSGKAG